MKSTELEVGKWYLLKQQDKNNLIYYCCGRVRLGKVVLENSFGDVFIPAVTLNYQEIPNCTGFSHKFWDQPSFLKKGWVARNSTGKWYWCETKLIADDNPVGEWFNRDLTNLIDLSCLNWTPPHSDYVPWDQTLTEIL